MATKKRERIGIWIIALTMAIGSLGVYFSIILANNNGDPSQQSDEELLQEYIKQQEEAARQNAEASEPLSGYAAAAFNAPEVISLQTTDLKVGDGKEVKEGDTITVSYFGWTPDGKLFDSTTQDGTNEPAEGFKLEEGNLIEGWIKGIPGMKVGGVRELTIPADMAYKEAGSPPLIGANTPLKFIVRIEGVQE